MTEPATSFVPALAFGFALGIAPGPVQVLILSQSAKRGLAGGLRVMLGANLTLFLILLALALGLSAVAPSDAALRILAVVGGIALVAFAALDLRSIHRPVAPADGSKDRSFGPTATGVVAVLLNPGAWLFFATTATATLAAATDIGGRGAAVVTATAMAIGVSLADLVSTGVGSGGHRVLGPRGLAVLRTVLGLALVALGVLFVARGLTGGV
ncbi:MAG TPA: LysE family transporter [Actinomycetota bacterium]|nr:LysE family transporter [Actinomycetota bacterium]